MLQHAHELGTLNVTSAISSPSIFRVNQTIVVPSMQEIYWQFLNWKFMHGNSDIRSFKNASTCPRAWYDQCYHLQKHPFWTKVIRETHQSGEQNQICTYDTRNLLEILNWQFVEGNGHKRRLQERCNMTKSLVRPMLSSKAPFPDQGYSTNAPLRWTKPSIQEIYCQVLRSV